MSDNIWRRWGKEDPYFGVYSDEKYRKANLAKHRDEFFLTGYNSVRNILDRAERHFGNINYRSTLEFGCGVGRMTIPLAQRFSRVIGLDISQDVMAEARKNAQNAGVSNADFLLSDDELTNAPGKFDFVLSYIVLQHIEPRRGMQIIGRLLDRVAEDGIVSIQASVVRPEATMMGRLRYELRHRIPVLGGIYGLFRGRGWSTLTMRMSEYDPVAILRLFKSRGIGDVLVTEHAQGDILTYHFMGKKARVNQI